jgi:hypothetical protein
MIYELRIMTETINSMIYELTIMAETNRYDL